MFDGTGQLAIQQLWPPDGAVVHEPQVQWSDSQLLLGTCQSVLKKDSACMCLLLVSHFR